MTDTMIIPSNSLFRGARRRLTPKERSLPHPRLQDRADKGAGVLLPLREEIVAIDNAKIIWNGKDCRRDESMTIFVGHQYSIDGGQRFFELAQLQMQRLFLGLNLFVGKVSNNSVDAGEGQVDGLKYLVCVFRKNVQRRGQLLVGVGKGIAIINPAGIGKNRQRNDDCRHQHGLEKP